MTKTFINPLARGATGVVGKARTIKEWTRDLLDLPLDVVVSVNELACHVPGCPPRETVVLVMTAPGQTRQISIHKGLVDVTRADLSAAFFQQANPDETRSASPPNDFNI
jgi:hypothetical protein